MPGHGRHRRERRQGDEELNAVAGGRDLATCGKLGTTQMAYYDDGDDIVGAFLEGFITPALRA